MKSIRELISPSRLSILAVPFFVGTALLAPIDSTHTAGLIGADPAACAQDGDCLDEAIEIFNDNVDNCSGILDCTFDCTEDFGDVTSWSCSCEV